MKSNFFKTGLACLITLCMPGVISASDVSWTDNLTFSCVADDGETIYMSPKQIKGLYPIFSPEESFDLPSNYSKITCSLSDAGDSQETVIASVYKVNYWQGEKKKRVQFYELQAYRPGLCKLTVTVSDPTGGDETLTKEYKVVVSYDDYETPVNGFEDGTILLNEEWFGHTNGGLNYLTPENEVIYQVYEHENPEQGFGATSQFGTIWAEKLFVVSKQPADGGDPLPGGGHLVIVDAKSLKKLGSIFKLEYDGVTGDGRAVAGATPDKVYVTTSNGIFIVDISDVANPLVTGRIGVGAENSNLYTGQMGDIINGGRYVFAIKQATGVFIIDPETDEIVKTIENSTVQGITQTSDGTVWFVATEDGCSKLHPIDSVSLMEGETVALPSSIGTVTCSWGAWRTTAFKGSYSGNDIWFITGGGGITGGSLGGYFKYHVGDDPENLEPLFVLSLDCSEAEIPDFYNQKNYSCPIYDPRNNCLLVMTCSSSSSGHYRNNWLHIIDGNSGEIRESKYMEPYYWFPALPIIPDKYLPELNDSDYHIELTMEKPEDFTVDLYDIISDKDNIQANMTFNISEESLKEEGIKYSLEGSTLTVSPVKDGEYVVEVVAKSNGRSATINIPVSVAQKFILPSAPEELGVEASEMKARIFWTASEGDVKEYVVELDGKEIGRTELTEFEIEGLSPYTEYRVGIFAICINDEPGDKVTIVFKTTDETAPEIIREIVIEIIDSDYALLKWEEPADNAGVKGYEIYLNGVLLEEKWTEQSFELTDLTPETSYIFGVVSFDESGNKSEMQEITFSTFTTGVSLLSSNRSIIYSGNALLISGMKDDNFEIYNIKGNLVDSFRVLTEREAHVLNLEKGLYFVVGRSSETVKFLVK